MMTTVDFDSVEHCVAVCAVLYILYPATPRLLYEGRVPNEHVQRQKRSAVPPIAHFTTKRARRGLGSVATLILDDRSLLGPGQQIFGRPSCKAVEKSLGRFQCRSRLTLAPPHANMDYVVATPSFSFLLCCLRGAFMPGCLNCRYCTLFFSPFPQRSLFMAFHWFHDSWTWGFPSF